LQMHFPTRREPTDTGPADRPIYLRQLAPVLSTCGPAQFPGTRLSKIENGGRQNKKEDLTDGAENKANLPEMPFTHDHVLSSGGR
jgi:hypothetical protein